MLERQGPYQQRCLDAKRGFNFVPPEGERNRRSEVHHIVCEHAMRRWKTTYASDPKKVEYISDCLSHVDWDINDVENLIGLPRNRHFKEAYVGPSDSWEPKMLPSHHVDHLTADGYSDQVDKWLTKNVWKALDAQRKSHKVDPKDIKSQLEECTRIFKKQLVDCGAREGGTVQGWKNRFEDDWETRWYRPFSMIPEPSERARGTSPEVLTGVFKKM